MNEQKARNIFFILLTGENEKLAVEEVKSVINTVEGHIRIIGIKGRIVFLESKLENIEYIARRIVLAHAVYENILTLDILDFKDLKLEVVLKYAIKNIDVKKVFGKCNSFRIGEIKVLEKGRSFKETNILRMKVGELLKRISGCKVDLRNPDIQVDIFVTHNSIIIGKWITKTARKDVLRYGPAIRPIKQSSTMNPLHARVLVNLSQIKNQELLLDPFCGTGGILIEGGQVGANLIGVDINAKMLRGCSVNLRFFSLKQYRLFRGNALYLPLKDDCIDAIATDPPYGKAASTHGVNFEKLMREFLEEAERVLKKMRYVAFAMPNKYNVYNLLPSNRLKVVVSEDVYVHRKLIRKFIAMRKEG